MIRFINLYYSMIEGRPEIQRVSALENNSKLVCLQLAELQKTVHHLSIQNKKKYQQILRYKPAFECRLYKANENHCLSKGAARELLLRQLDRLMEEENLLERELSLIKIHSEQLQSEKQALLSSEITPYEALRSIWKRTSPKYDSAVEHMESLNGIIGHIRNSLKKITQIESSSSEESQSEYLKYYAIERCASETCNNCVALQQSKNQLRVKYEQLQKDCQDIRIRNEVVNLQLAKKDEQIRKLTTKIMEREAESHKKLYQLEQKLAQSDQMVKQLKRFKEDLESNAFFNPQENYQLFIQTDRDLLQYPKCISLQMNCLLQLLTNNQISLDEPESHFQFNQVQSEIRGPEMEIACNQLIIPQLSFGNSINSKEKALTKKSSLTDRPRTERLKQNLNQKLQCIQELQLSSRKYIRTNQLTTKRNGKPTPFSYLEGQCNASTVKLSNSPKNIEEDTRR